MIDISICCTAYNHQNYIAKALEGMLAQKGDFTMEILVHDDCSTDATARIIAEYAQKYPKIIKPVLQTKNQYSKGVPINETFNFSRAQGKYIALCEGDDMWIDPCKLQKQFAYMEANPTCSFCFTNALVQDEADQGKERDFLPYYPKDAGTYNKAVKEYNVAEMLGLSFIPTASFFFKTEHYKQAKDFLCKPFPYGDMRFKLVFTSFGYAKLIDDKTCIYRLNVPNSALALWGKEKRAKAFARYLSVCDFLAEMNERTKGQYKQAFAKESADFYGYALQYTSHFAQLRQEGVKQAFVRLPFLQKARLLGKLLFLKIYGNRKHT